MFQNHEQKVVEQEVVKPKLNPIEFERFFERKSAWTALHSAEEITAVLRSKYSTFFDDAGVNVGAVITALRGGPLTAKARDLYKELFRMGWGEKHSANVQSTENFSRLKNEYGNRIMAHGVETAKGGLVNIVMMCITGTVKSISSYWGHLINGPANISPVSHGPYFIIHNIAFDSSSKKPAPNNPSCEQIAYVLVPCVEIAVLLKEKLVEAKDMGFINQETLDKFQSKIVTYDELYGICVENVVEETTCSDSKQRKHSLEFSLANANTNVQPKRRRTDSTFFASDQIVIAETTAAATPEPQNMSAP